MVRKEILPSKQNKIERYYWVFLTPSQPPRFEDKTKKKKSATTYEVLILGGHGVGVGPFPAVPGGAIQTLQAGLPAPYGVLGSQQVSAVSELVDHDVLVVPPVAPSTWNTDRLCKQAVRLLVVQTILLYVLPALKPSIHPFVPSVHPASKPSIQKSVHPSIHPHPSVYSSTCPPTHPSIHPPHPSVYQPINSIQITLLSRRKFIRGA